MLDNIITIIAVVFLAIVVIVTWPGLASTRTTDVLTGRKRQAFLAITALAAPVAAALAAFSLIWQPALKGRFALNYVVTKPGEQSLDPVVARLVAAITANPSAKYLGRENPEWCRRVLKA